MSCSWEKNYVAHSLSHVIFLVVSLVWNQLWLWFCFILFHFVLCCFAFIWGRFFFISLFDFLPCFFYHGLVLDFVFILVLTLIMVLVSILVLVDLGLAMVLVLLLVW